MEHRDERIVIETNRYRITGNLSLPRDGFRSRLTDYLNAAERAFIALTDVEIAQLDGGWNAELGNWDVERRAFIVLALSQIVMAMPADAAAVQE